MARESTADVRISARRDARSERRFYLRRGERAASGQAIVSLKTAITLQGRQRTRRPSTAQAFFRHAVKSSPEILSVRVDESYYFANARYLEDFIDALTAERRALKHVVLMCSSVNMIDALALESL